VTISRSILIIQNYSRGSNNIKMMINWCEKHFITPKETLESFSYLVRNEQAMI